MTNPNYTHITFVLDNSGSMNSIKPKTMEGFNNFLREQKKIPGKVTFSLYQFHDSQNRWSPHNGAGIQTISNLNPEYQKPSKPDTVQPIYEFQDLSIAYELNDETYRCDTMTPLLDAMGYAVDETGRGLASLSEINRPSKVVVVILTDGAENASIQYTRDQVFAKNKHQADTYNWQFVFLGANQDAVATGASFGIQAASSMSYAATGASLTSTFNAVSASVGALRSRGTNIVYDAATRAAVMKGDPVASANTDTQVA